MHAALTIIVPNRHAARAASPARLATFLTIIARGGANNRWLVSKFALPEEETCPQQDRPDS
jgi:hypothetical protein